MTAVRPARADDFPAIATLLTGAKLPLAGVEDHLAGFLVAAEHDAIVGCAALEYYGTVALLRSVVVAADTRGTGLGKELTSACIAAARERGVTTLALLTETAPAFFARFGFEKTTRSALPATLNESVEFRGACPASAQAMLLHL